MALTTLFISILYFGGLFWLARWGDSGTERAQAISRHPLVYSLTFAIYCTSWTYYGAVGNAAQTGWSYLPIYLGPLLLLIFGYPFIKKILEVSKKQNVTSLADFLSSRYGKRRYVAIFVTLIAILATIPYIALQLKALGMSFNIIASSQGQATSFQDNEMVLVATVLMMFFAISFGAKKVDITEYRGGLMLAIAFESVVKLVALVAIAIFAFSFEELNKTPVSNPFSGWQSNDFLSTNFLTQTFMAAAAFICLPRQYHVAVVENEDVNQLKMARWVFAAYLIMVSVAIVPITLAGLGYFSGSNVNADTFVLALPLMTDNTLLGILAFIGGLSASTAMIIVATLALSTMVSNDVMLPLLFRNEHKKIKAGSNYIGRIINIRRFTIVGILASSFAYHYLFSSNAALSNIGLLAFSLVIQLLPVLVGGLYWKTGHANGVYAGLGSGLLTCLLFMFNPDPEVNVTQSDYLVQMVIVSLLVNTAAYIVFSLKTVPRLLDKMQSATFVNPSVDNRITGEQQVAHINNGDLTTLLKTFLGQTRTENLLADFQQNIGQKFEVDEIASADLIQHCELLLGGVIGASSSRSVMSAVLSGKSIEFEDMVNIFDETTQALSFNQNILFTSLESIEQGISVVNENLQLVAWNKRYLELFEYPDEMVRVGMPIEQMIRYNAERGECGPGELEEQVSKRVNFMSSGSAHRFLRQRADGSVIEMVGNPLPNGGFVTSFTDVTEHIETQQALKESNIDLKKRVSDRSQEISNINDALKDEIARRSTVEIELQIAKAQAEQANALKTRFLALASHDVLQPLNAAKLYLAAINKDVLDEKNLGIIDKVGISLRSTESLIQTLLEISQLDEGNVVPENKTFDIKELLEPLMQENGIMAERKGLDFRSHISSALVKTDPNYLKRIVQNLISNAIKYTPKGGVLVALRNYNNMLKIQIYDTGIGISEYEQQQIFKDFYRVSSQNESGDGLGLAVVSRLSALLHSPISIISNVGRGSRFEIRLPLYEGEAEHSLIHQPSSGTKNIELNILCVDDEQNNLDALSVLLEKWGCDGQYYTQEEELIENIKKLKPEVILMDYQLNPDGRNGLELIEYCRRELNSNVPAILITALRDKELRKEAVDMEVSYLSKPVKPAALRALLTKVTKQKTKTVNRLLE